MSKDIYANIASRIKEIINSPYFVDLYPEEERALIELVFSAFDAGVDPRRILNTGGKEKILSILNIDLDDLSPFSDDGSSSNQTPELSANTIDVKQVICSHFSNNKDLSDSYQYANPVSRYSCSCSEVKGGLCLLPTKQNRCPFYAADIQLYATYTHSKDSNVIFNVYRHRSTTGFTFFTIYDKDNNLVHNLSYDSNTVFDHTKEDFNSELESIVKQTYSYVDPTCSFTYLYHNQKSENPVIASSNSYIATLVSIS